MWGFCVGTSRSCLVKKNSVSVFWGLFAIAVLDLFLGIVDITSVRGLTFNPDYLLLLEATGLVLSLPVLYTQFLTSFRNWGFIFIFGYSWYNFSKRLNFQLWLFSPFRCNWSCFIFTGVMYSIFNKLPFVLTVSITHKISDTNRSHSRLSKTALLSIIYPMILEKWSFKEKNTNPKRLLCLNLFHSAFRLWHLRRSCLLGSFMWVVCS